MVDHNYVSIISTLTLVAIGFLAWMGRGWIKHVNEQFIAIWQHIEKEAEARERRWAELHHSCVLHSERIAKLEGRLNGKDKVFDVLGIRKGGKE